MKMYAFWQKKSIKLCKGKSFVHYIVYFRGDDDTTAALRLKRASAVKYIRDLQV